MGHTISQHLPTRFWLHALVCAPTWGLSGASSIRCTWKRGGFFGLLLYFYVHQFPSPCTGIVSSHDKEQPPPASQPEGQTQLLQTHTFLPSRSCWKALLYSNHHGLWGIWDIQCRQPYPHWSHNVSYLVMLASLGKFVRYLLLGNKPTFSVDFRVTKEGICFSSWIFNRIGCRTPQNIERIPSMNGVLPSRWRKTVK